MDTNKKIEELLGKILGLIGDDKESMEWFKEVQVKASKFKTDEEDLRYLQGILEQLQNHDEDNTETAKRYHNKTVIALAILAVLIILATVWYYLTPKADAVSNSTVVSTISNAVNLPKEEFQVVDYRADGDAVVYNSEIANAQQKVFANGSKEDSLSSNANNAVNEMVQYMSHNAAALKEKAMTFGIIDTNTDVKDWLEKGKDGKVYYNEKGKDVYYQTKAFLSRSKISSKKMEEGSNYYATGVNAKGDVVVSERSQNLSGQEYIEISNPKDSNEKYRYCVLVYCGNTVMRNNNIPGVKTGKIEIPTKPNKPGKPGKPSEPDKPGKPSEPSKPSESKVEKKDPGKDPANQGKALVGGGQNDGSVNGSETSQAKLPESYSAPAAPATPVQSSSSSSAAPSQDARISEPSQWSGAGKVTDSNGTTTVTNDGSVTTPDGRHYDGLVGQSAPKVESGANGVTAPSSSANFAGNSSMSEPAIDD